MTRELQVGPLGEADSFDLLVCTLGYESRAINVARMLETRTERILAIEYDIHHVHNFAVNLEYFQAHEVLREPASAIRKSLIGYIHDVRESLAARDEERAPRVAVDIRDRKSVV